MDPTSPLPAICCTLIALVTALILAKIFGIDTRQGRYASIDGLRGFLAFAVFMHHSCIWYFFLRSGKWEVPPSNFYTHCGQGGVAFFFMITGFLFFGKLLDARVKKIEWGGLFVSRIFRLTPLYLLVMVLMFAMVAYLSQGKLNEPLANVVKESICWLGFTILGNPQLNGVPAALITAGVTWSLPYEIFFYLSLPVLALTVKVVPPARYIALGVLSIIALILWLPNAVHLASFAGGIVAALLVRNEAFRQFATKKIATLIPIGSTVLAVALFPSAYEIGPILLFSVAFIIIACGNDSFGLLVCRPARLLGEISYSIYLLHGFTLFTTFYFLNTLNPDSFSPLMHWTLIAAITPVLVLFCFATFRLVENPGMLAAPKLTAWLQSRHAKERDVQAGE